MSVKDRSLRAESVRPLHDEHCERQMVCNSTLSANSDMNDIELDGETDDEDMEDGKTLCDDGSSAVRTSCDPGQPTGSQRREHMNTHLDPADHGASSV